MEGLYYVKNLDCTAYLRAKGFKVVKTEFEKGVVKFYFDDTEELRAEKSGFYNDSFISAYNTSQREVWKEVRDMKSYDSAVQEK
jgi:hypothetical protein